MRTEHERIAELVEQLRGVPSGEGADPAVVRAEAEAECLTVELEAHLTYAEERLIPLL